ncbi:MAG: hypothetical protein ACK4SX_12275 [Alcanivoracaceae bacterium]
MNDIPNDKQKRLMSLNQDVLAVSPTSTQAREALSQKPRVRAEREQPAPASAAGRGRGVALALGGLSVVMLVLLGVVSLTLLKMQERIDQLQRPAAASASVDLSPLQSRLSDFEGLLAVLEERVALLEQQPVPAAITGGRSEGVSSEGLAQVNARLRKVDIETSRLTADLGRFRQEMAAALARVDRAEAQSNSQREALAALTPRIDTLSATVSQMDSRAKLTELEGRLDRTNNDIRNLYRMLEMGR